MTEITFPTHFTDEQREAVLVSIRHCAVKELIHDGSSIEFVTQQTAAK
jgi:hypothetical protein